MIRGIVAAVSYLNTKPMIYGIEAARDTLRAELLLSPPAVCASLFGEGRADVALVPVAEIPSFAGSDIVTDFCIGSHGHVRTVVLMANCPVENLHTIYLDAHSRTSAALVRVLAREYWDIDPCWLPLYDCSDMGREGAGYLLIGDKVFEHEGRFEYVYDLSSVWRDFTGLPFVFAAWVASRSVDREFVADLNRAIAYGVGHIDQAVDYYDLADKPLAREYLKKNIDFRLDDQKREALALFWQKAVRNGAIPGPG